MKHQVDIDFKDRNRKYPEIRENIQKNKITMVYQMLELMIKIQKPQRIFSKEKARIIMKRIIMIYRVKDFKDPIQSFQKIVSIFYFSNDTSIN